MPFSKNTVAFGSLPRSISASVGVAELASSLAMVSCCGLRIVPVGTLQIGAQFRATLTALRPLAPVTTASSPGRLGSRSPTATASACVSPMSAVHTRLPFGLV